MREKPPRRLLLACSLIDRAEFSEVRRLESNSFFDEDNEGLFPRNMSMMSMDAEIAGGMRTCASMMPVHSDYELPVETARDLLKSGMVDAIYNNSYIVGPRGTLPQ